MVRWSILIRTLQEPRDGLFVMTSHSCSGSDHVIHSAIADAVIVSAGTPIMLIRLALLLCIRFLRQSLRVMCWNMVGKMGVR
jgi:hypothetical protein